MTGAAVGGAMAVRDERKRQQGDKAPENIKVRAIPHIA